MEPAVNSTCLQIWTAEDGWHGPIEFCVRAGIIAELQAGADDPRRDRLMQYLYERGVPQNLGFQHISFKPTIYRITDRDSCVISG